MVSRRGLSVKICLVLAAVAISLVVVVFAWSRDATALLVQQGDEALARGELRKAKSLAHQALKKDPESDAVSLLAGRVAVSLNRPQEALEYFERIPDNGSEEAKSARRLSGDVFLFGLLQLSNAEGQYRRLLAQDKFDVDANERLAYIEGLGSRSWEAVPHRLALIREGKIDRLQMFVLSMGELALENPAELRRYHTVSPNDPVALTGLARVAINEHQSDRAEELLRQAIDADPEFAEAQAELGAILVEKGIDTEFLKWHEVLPPSADNHPGIWAARGWWALNHKQHLVAVRCLWEALHRDSSRHAASYHLGQALLAAGMSKQSEEFFARADGFQRYLYNCHMVHIAPEDDNLEELQAAASSAESLGLLWEAYGWSKLVIKYQELRGSGAANVPATDDSPAADCLRKAEETISRLQPIISNLTLSDRTAPAANPARQIDLSSFPLPEWGNLSRGQENPKLAGAAETTVRFEEVSGTAGVRFSYFNGRQSEASGPAKLYEQLGGGVAILDYDLDGWPDIYFTQGGRWPAEEGNLEYLDRLYRNNGDGTFEDVTERAGLLENGFSQGVAAADIDNDGWPDLYVANIGRNRLYRNHGDGTFTEVAVRGNEETTSWSTSCAIADLNGDALPDIYVVNYLSGEDLFTRICRGPDGSKVPCAIQGYPAAQDQLLRNNGDGEFVDVTEESGIVASDGRGLGIVAADFDGSGSMSVFVANDVSPNFFFVNQSPRADRNFQFQEEALQRGLAASSTGSYEACMGVGAGDANGDGRLDLYVTNFFQESSTLYVQAEGVVFQDRTAISNLAETSMAMLGFGTQFLDGDLDGQLDLIVTNGHINDLRRQGIPYRMRAQYYQNVGHGRYEELRAPVVGEFFDRQQLGRGMARVDWNRDGLPDVVATHIDSAAALLLNRSRNPGRFIALQLRGVESSRDATGTQVTAHVDQGTQRPAKIVRHLVAGDGFHACNQRILTFGLGKHSQLQTIEVRWPSGKKQSFSDLKIDSEYLLIEGNDVPQRIPAESAR